ncbi:uncharacterized protein KGF55_002915 [Candida pseudojiufengensis]|uniref:uncharacterized protein n=1 Tax=Candida pseudojiufengensis TaxID=497109 RepID=UPI0022244452|nr:uncharacterized protein KGF55_002915 [Candida pseudojiufengensis]KAI5963123.1 hypothetical protein KGF55_002915 [Candida pseudojiufengensis]
MGWLSFGSTKSEIPPQQQPPLPTTNLQQRSHSQLTTPQSPIIDSNYPKDTQSYQQQLNNQESDIETTLNQLSHKQLSSNATTDSKTIEQTSNINVQTINTKEVTGVVTKFLESYPISNLFIIDGERDLKKSIICTSNNDNGKTCLKLGINSIELFKIMQKNEYFCSLPNDVDATYFECRKIQ